MKKILFVESYPHVFFGQQRTLLSLLNICQEFKINPLVVVTSEGPFTDELELNRIPFIFFRYPELLSSYGGSIYRIRGMRRLKLLWQVFVYIWSIRKKLRQKNFDAVFCNDMRGLLTVGIAARSLGLSVMIWDKLDKPHGLLDWLQLPLVSKNLIISDSVRNKYPVLQQKLYQKKIMRIYNGADLSRFVEAFSIRKELPGDTGDILVAIVGTITERKGHDRLISVWDQLIILCPNLTLLVVGETSGNVEDENFLSSLKIFNAPKVHFLGMRKDVPNIMNSVDMLVVPSRYEGMGQVTVEAMACGVPVIGANTGGIPEVVIDEETGFIIEGDSQQDMINAVIRLTLSAELRKKMGAAGRARVEKYFNRPLQMKKVLQQLVEMK